MPGAPFGYKKTNYGLYKCVAMNLARRTSSREKRLTVVSKAVKIPTINTSRRIGKNSV